MTISDHDLSVLRAALSGDVRERGNPALPAEVVAQNTLILHDPELAVIPHSEGDVRAAVRFAATHGLPVRIQATGHGAEAPVTDGLLLLTKRMLDVSVDPSTRVATIGAGVRWEAVIRAAAEHGLAPITGSSTHVGAIGYTLGGGLGPLARSHGFTSDWVRGFRVVLADGSVVTAEPTSIRTCSGHSAAARADSASSPRCGSNSSRSAHCMPAASSSTARTSKRPCARGRIGCRAPQPRSPHRWP